MLSYYNTVLAHPFNVFSPWVVDGRANEALRMHFDHMFLLHFSYSILNKLRQNLGSACEFLTDNSSKYFVVHFFSQKSLSFIFVTTLEEVLGAVFDGGFCQSSDKPIQFPSKL